MSKTREIRSRIKAVKNTAKITRAMQLVASSKMKKAQDAALEGRPYAELLARMLATLQEHLPEFKHPYLEERAVKTRGVLVMATDRGLCGPLNSNLFRELVKLDRAHTQFFSIGRKAKQFLTRTQRNLVADFAVSEQARFQELRPAVEMMLGMYEKGEIDSVEVLFPRFKNTLVQAPTLISFLPLVNFHDQIAERLQETGQTLISDERDMTFEPSAEAILNQLLERFVKREIYQRLLETRASEHSARMVAMKAATDNAKKLNDSLTLQYNKARQASITQEILEITAAANTQ